MIATDLLAQAEHDVRTRVGLITTDAAPLPRRRSQKSSGSWSIFRPPTWPDRPGATMARSSSATDEEAMIAYSDFIAAEHLQVHTARSAGDGREAAQLRLAVHRARSRAWSIRTSAAAPTTRCRPWGPGATPAGCGSAPT